MIFRPVLNLVINYPDVILGSMAIKIHHQLVALNS